jgi:hypothetical protein
MTDPGGRDVLVIVERQGAEQDDGYTKQPGEWAEYARGWARVRYGSAAERRESAQERAAQPATFEFDWTPKLEQARTTDRLVAVGYAWDISSAIVTGLRREVHITAVANLETSVAVDLT